jgi:hypothetical protein
MWEDYYGWGGPQQWGGQADYMQLATPISSSYSSYNPITLPTEFWPDQSTYDATTAHMASLGITNAPRGTLDPNVTSQYGQATYNQPSWMDDPLTPAMIMMGGAALGGGFANGGAGYGAGAYGGSATTYPLASSGGSISATPLAGAGGGAGALGAADGLSEITVGAQRLPGGLDSLGGGGMWDQIMGGMSGNWGPLIGGLLGYADANNQPDSMSSSYAPDAAITGAGRDALAQMQALFANGGPGVAGMDPASLAAIQGLQGFASGNNINPYLDNVYNSAATSTQNRLTSEFSRGGRNLDARFPARSEELQHLAAGIYGQGYENERQRQYGSLLPLLGAGEYSRGINQQQMDQPYQNQLRYSAGLNSLLPLFPGTNTQPLFNNPLAGFLGGAQLGSLFTNQG